MYQAKGKGIPVQFSEQVAAGLKDLPQKFMKKYKRTITISVPVEEPPVTSRDLSSSLLGNLMSEQLSASRGPSGYGQSTQRQVSALAGRTGQPPGMMANQPPHKSMVMGTERMYESIRAPYVPKDIADANASDEERHNAVLGAGQAKKRRATSDAVKKAARKALKKG